MPLIRENLKDSGIRDAVGYAAKFMECGAHTWIEGEVVFAYIPPYKIKEITECLEKKLSEQEKVMLEHALASWDMLYNGFLDALAEQGMDKRSLEAQEEAEREAFEYLSGSQFNPEILFSEFKMGMCIPIDTVKSWIKHFRYLADEQYNETGKHINPQKMSEDEFIHLVKSNVYNEVAEYLENQIGESQSHE